MVTPLSRTSVSGLSQSPAPSPSTQLLPTLQFQMTPATHYPQTLQILLAIWSSFEREVAIPLQSWRMPLLREEGTSSSTTTIARLHLSASAPTLHPSSVRKMERISSMHLRPTLAFEFPSQTPASLAKFLRITEGSLIHSPTLVPPMTFK